MCRSERRRSWRSTLFRKKRDRFATSRGTRGRDLASGMRVWLHEMFIESINQDLIGDQHKKLDRSGKFSTKERVRDHWNFALRTSYFQTRSPRKFSHTQIYPLSIPIVCTFRMHIFMISFQLNKTTCHRSLRLQTHRTCHPLPFVPESGSQPYCSCVDHPTSLQYWFQLYAHSVSASLWRSGLIHENVPDNLSRPELLNHVKLHTGFDL